MVLLPPSQVIEGLETGVNVSFWPLEEPEGAAERVKEADPTAVTWVPAGRAVGVVASLTTSLTRTLPKLDPQDTLVEAPVRAQGERANGAEEKVNCTVPVGTTEGWAGTTDAVKCTAVACSGGRGDPATYVFDPVGVMVWVEECELAL
jgi:hypothetical protein